MKTDNTETKFSFLIEMYSELCPKIEWVQIPETHVERSQTSIKKNFQSLTIFTKTSILAV